MSPPPCRIAMWSGPRNISTAMMRSFDSRPDTVVCDEPLYAHYLQVTGLDHPGRAETLATQDSDWRRVVATLSGPVPGGKQVWYQKHMSHHLLPDIGRDWLDELSHAFLIREPAAMLRSLLAKTPEAGRDDTGLPQQWEIFERVADKQGAAPPVVLASDVLKDPPAMLGRLCQSLNLPYMDEMLSWKPGRRDTDGAWAPYWYAAVEQSTGFAPWHAERCDLEPSLQPLLEQCQPYYEKLYAYRLQPEAGGCSSNSTNKTAT